MATQKASSLSGRERQTCRQKRDRLEKAMTPAVLKLHSPCSEETWEIVSFFHPIHSFVPHIHFLFFPDSHHPLKLPAAPTPVVMMSLTLTVSTVIS